MRRILTTAAALALTIGLALPAQAAAQPTIVSGAALEVYPRPPFVDTTYRTDLGSIRRTVYEQAWIYRVDRATNQIKATLGFRSLRLVNVCCRTDTVNSYPVQVLAGDCLIPAGHVLSATGAVYASTVGPRYCW